MSNTKTTSNEYLTMGQAARELGYSPPTVQRMVDRGVIEVAFRTPGYHARFHADEVARIKSMFHPAPADDAA